MGKREDHLAEFRYQALKSGSVLLYWKWRHIKTLSGVKAGRFLDKISEADPQTAMQLMAKATGNFKRGNEKLPSITDRKR
jgi:hypothetical protein